MLWTGVGGQIGEEAERQAPVIGILGALIVPATVSILIFLEDASRNTALNDQGKRRWRRLIAAIPYTLVVYWWRFGRREGSA